MLDLSIGSSVGVNSTTPMNAENTTKFTTELSTRVKALHVIGAEFSYNPSVEAQTEGLKFDGQFRLSALLYVLPLEPVAAYLKAGMGGDSLEDLVNPGGKSTSYHAGGGLDIDITDNFVLSAEFLFLVPGITSIKSVIQNYANGELSRIQDPFRAGEAPAKQPGMSDFLSANNFRVAVGARYTF
jgi:opacity protein-like surface antigen